MSGNVGNVWKCLSFFRPVKISCEVYCQECFFVLFFLFNTCLVGIKEVWVYSRCNDNNTVTSLQCLSICGYHTWSWIWGDHAITWIIRFTCFTSNGTTIASNFFRATLDTSFWPGPLEVGRLKKMVILCGFFEGNAWFIKKKTLTFVWPCQTSLAKFQRFGIWNSLGSNQISEKRSHDSVI